MPKEPAFPYQAHIMTIYGGQGWKRARTLEEAIDKAEKEKPPKSYDGVTLPIQHRWVTDTRGNVLWERDEMSDAEARQLREEVERQEAEARRRKKPGRRRIARHSPTAYDSVHSSLPGGEAMTSTTLVAKALTGRDIESHFRLFRQIIREAEKSGDNSSEIVALMDELYDEGQELSHKLRRTKTKMAQDVLVRVERMMRDAEHIAHDFQQRNRVYSDKDIQNMYRRMFSYATLSADQSRRSNVRRSAVSKWGLQGRKQGVGISLWVSKHIYKWRREWEQEKDELDSRFVRRIDQLVEVLVDEESDVGMLRKALTQARKLFDEAYYDVAYDGYEDSEEARILDYHAGKMNEFLNTAKGFKF